MSEDKKKIEINSNTSRGDVQELIDLIVEDNQFELASLMKECDIAASTKKFTIEHLSTICKVKGYELLIKQSEDTIYIKYYLENQNVESTEESSLNDLDLDDDPTDDLSGIF